MKVKNFVPVLAAAAVLVSGVSPVKGLAAPIQIHVNNTMPAGADGRNRG